MERRGYCTLCRSRCGTRNVVQDDRLVRVVPDTDHPTGQSMCMKGRAAPELVHSPHRILYPMRRTRPKDSADPGWRRISWDEALSETAGRLAAIRAESGAESVAFGVTTPSGTPLSDSIDWIERFVRVFGSPNICYATEICNWHKDYAHAFTFGCGMPVADYAHAGLIMLWGHNPANTWLAQAHAIGVGRAAGARLLVVDPRRTALAAQADVWLQVRPGSDAAVALGLAHLLLSRRGYDEGFVRHWTNAPLLVRGDTGRLLRPADIGLPGADGSTWVAWDEAAGAPAPYDTRFDAAAQGASGFALDGRYDIALRDGGRVACRPALALLAERCAAYTPARTSELSGVPQQQLRAAAELIAQARPVAYHAWTGIGQHTNASQTERAVAVLYALTGSFDVTGGNRQHPRQPAAVVNGLDLIPAAQRAKALGLAERPLGPPAQGWITARDMYTAILEQRPYPIRAMMAFGSNPLASQADVAMGEAALQALEFHVHCDLFETPSSRYADILLPINTPWEREGLRMGFEISAQAQELVQLRPRMVTPRGESRSDNDIVFDLATRLGMGEQFFDGSLERGWNHMLAPLGLTVADLRQAEGGVRRRLTHIDRKYAAPPAATAPSPPAGEGAPVTCSPVAGFATESRRVELYSELLLRHGYDPLPDHVEPADSPRDGDGRYPLVLTSAKSGYYCHSQHRSLVSLRKRDPVPRVAMHPLLARRRGIAAGDWVRVRTRTGTARFVAQLQADLQEHVVVADYGWWQACPEIGYDGFPVLGAAGSNYNALISADKADPISGSIPMRSFLCDIERDPASDPGRRAWPGMRAFQVTELRRRPHDVLEIAFTPLDGGELAPHRPGQHITLRVPAAAAADAMAPGATSAGQEVDAAITRAYSLIDAADTPRRRSYTIAVRHQCGTAPNGQPWQGAMSGHLHTRLRAGDHVELGAPSGNFVLPTRSPQPIVLFAGGIGITPFLAYLETLAAQPDAARATMPRVWLHYANRSRASVAFADRIQALGATLPALTVRHYYSDASDAHSGSGRYAGAAAVDDALIAQRARFYLCGPTPMMRAITEGLVARGVPSFDIFSETFRSPARVDLDPARQYAVRFARAGNAAATWSGSRGTLLAFAESLGLALPSGCRVGQCESCAVRILEGRVRHLHGVEPEDPDVCLTCQAVPTTDLVLDT
ncbi:molybdopterin-dependent oxidoreductase [Bordetella flabilis]|uniref:Ferredoxin:oxidoreductase FAD/NAD(P)-binding protein n=1 Tax=Bordetella flabilis TaxID=463014 RepID=A0A193GBZ7_9BORD|nr:molybdopterin-dependent oxidoreductase [Bordetella flabilis]ANN77537.1 ferredoxin:oxidoreductase FAD/NAD(P)-binding protein [Bordetella flabilis]